MKKDNTEYPFIRYPRDLIDNPLFSHISIEARTLFALILDRTGLSELNSERFTDENGEVFVYFTIEEISQKFGCSKPKASKILKELETNNLISKRRTNGSRPSKIYVKKFFSSIKKFDFAKSKNLTLQNQKNLLCKVKNFDVSYNNKSNNEISYNHSSIIENMMTDDEIKEQIEYDCIVCKENNELLDNIVMIISDIINSPAQHIRIGKEELPKEKVTARFAMLNSEHILSVISSLENTTQKITNIKQYIATLLYNAPATMQASVTAEFAYHNKKAV